MAGPGPVPWSWPWPSRGRSWWWLFDWADPPVHWDWRGAIDTLLPGLLLLTAAALLLRRSEASLRRRGYLEGVSDQSSTMAHLALVSAVSRSLPLALLLALPLPLKLARWDWWLAGPNVFEVLVHLRHWRDTGAAFKRALFVHHFVGLGILWPMYRYAETAPFPMGMLPYIVAFEMASAFSHLLYAAQRLGPAYLRAVGGMDENAAAAFMPHVYHGCFWAQRLLRWGALLTGIIYILRELRLYWLLIPGAVSLALELQAVSHQRHAMAALLRPKGIDSNSSSSEASPQRRRQQQQQRGQACAGQRSGKLPTPAAAAAAPAAGLSPERGGARHM